MQKTIPESRMLEEVRRWRAEAFDAMRRETPAEREQRTREWAERLGLPLLKKDDGRRQRTNEASRSSRRNP